MKPIRFLLLFALVIQLSSCAIVSSARLPLKDSKIEVYITTKPTKPYKEVAYLECMGSALHSNHRLLKKLAIKAEKAGYDALIQVEFKYVFLTPYVTAVAVKYQ